VAHGLYNALTALLEPGLVVVAPKADGKALALAVTPLKRLTADQAKLEPDKVQRAIRKALKKTARKTLEKPSKANGSKKAREAVYHESRKAGDGGASLKSVATLLTRALTSRWRWHCV
jgi:hypothetical protein